MSKPSDDSQTPLNAPPGQIMPGSPYAAYRLEQNGKEVGWVYCGTVLGGTEEIWQLYGTGVTGAHKAAYTWPSNQTVAGGQGTNPQSSSIATSFTYHSTQNAPSDLGGVGGPNYTQIRAVCGVQQH